MPEQRTRRVVLNIRHRHVEAEADYQQRVQPDANLGYNSMPDVWRGEKLPPGAELITPTTLSQPTRPAEPTEVFWQQKAAGVRGDTHSENQALGRIFVTHAGLKINAHTSDTSWQLTYEARVQAERAMRKTKEGGR